MHFRVRALALWVTACLAGGGAALASPAGARDLAGTATAVPPFKLNFTAKTVPGHPSELSLQTIRLVGAGLTHDAWFGGCVHCTGPGRFGRWRHAAGQGWVDPIVDGAVIITAHTQIVQAVTAAGKVGRFKVYAVRPGGGLLTLRRQGCISPTQQNLSRVLTSGIAGIDQAPCSGLLLPVRGTPFRSADPITVTFRVPQALPAGDSWLLAIDANTKGTGCANFDAKIFPQAGTSGELLTATLRPTDRLAIPSPLPQWCTGTFTVGAFAATGDRHSVKPISLRVDAFSVSP
jgi:hypothetical protein